MSWYDFIAIFMKNWQNSCEWSVFPLLPHAVLFPLVIFIAKLNMATDLQGLISFGSDFDYFHHNSCGDQGMWWAVAQHQGVPNGHWLQ